MGGEEMKVGWIQKMYASAMRGNVLTMGGLILIVIFAVIQLALGPTINAASSTAGTNSAANPVPTSATSISNLYPLVYAALGIVALLAAFGIM
jgi:hypothetical protein